MTDTLTIELDADDVIAALNALGDTAQPFVTAACRETADAVANEAAARLSRQLAGTSTPSKSRPDRGGGLTLAGIQVKTSGQSFLVVSDREPFPNLPLWLEKGTKHMAARPYFYNAAILEEGPHYRRIEDAIVEAIDAAGLGE